MLALIITLVPTISFAQSYTADDSYTLNSQYHDLFNNYFDGIFSYQYFPYKCNYGSYNNRECFYGIDSNGNYLKIDYVQNGSSYEVRYTTGVDNNFSVSGVNVFKKGIDPIYILLFLSCFVFLTILLHYLIGVGI